MDIAEVNAKVEEIRQFRGDNEAAHGREDDLYIAVLRAIADGATNAPELARAALQAEAIEYDRWYA